MVYNITKYDNTPLVSVPDSTIDAHTTSIALLGRFSVNFGLPINENFIALMQHFAGTSPPPNPLQGQIWFDSVISSLKVWDGTRWLIASPPFDGNAGTATVPISPTVEVVVMLSDSHIIMATSHQSVAPADLPTSAVIGDISYPFASRFPGGLAPGLTLATDPNNYQFYGTALTANILTTSRNITLSGSVTGNVLFNGSNDVVINSNLISVFNANISTGWYSNVNINSNGLITDATALNDNDIWTALQYTPPSNVIINGDASGGSSANGTVFTITVALGNTNVAPGTYNNVTVDSTGRVISANNNANVPITGIILWGSNVLIPGDWAACNGQIVVNQNGTINTPDLTSYSVGPTQYIMKVL